MAPKTDTLKKLIEEQKKDDQSQYLYPPKDEREKNLPIGLIDKILAKRLISTQDYVPS